MRAAVIRRFGAAAAAGRGFRDLTPRSASRPFRPPEYSAQPALLQLLEYRISMSLFTRAGYLEKLAPAPEPAAETFPIFPTFAVYTMLE